jgi:hypothetical protein
MAADRYEKDMLVCVDVKLKEGCMRSSSLNKAGDSEDAMLENSSTVWAPEKMRTAPTAVRYRRAPGLARWGFP